MFDRGRWWRANPPLDDGHGNLPKGWGNPFTEGTMVLVQEDLAVFTSRSGQIVEFIPWPPGLNKEPLLLANPALRDSSDWFLS